MSKKYWYIIIRSTDYLMVSLDHEMTEKDELPEWKVGNRSTIYGPWKRRPSESTAQKYFDGEL